MTSLYTFSTSVSLLELEKSAQESYFHAIEKLKSSTEDEPNNLEEVEEGTSVAPNTTKRQKKSVPQPMSPCDFSKESNLFLRYAAEVKKVNIFDLYTTEEEENNIEDNRDDAAASLESSESDPIKRLWYEFVINFNHKTLPSTKSGDWYSNFEMRPFGSATMTVRKEVNGFPLREPELTITQGHTNNNTMNLTEFDWKLALSREEKDLGKKSLDESKYTGQYVSVETFLGTPNSGGASSYAYAS